HPHALRGHPPIGVERSRLRLDLADLHGFLRRGGSDRRGRDRGASRKAEKRQQRGARSAAPGIGDDALLASADAHLRFPPISYLSDMFVACEASIGLPRRQATAACETAAAGASGGGSAPQRRPTPRGSL